MQIVGFVTTQNNNSILLWMDGTKLLCLHPQICQKVSIQKGLLQFSISIKIIFACLSVSYESHCNRISTSKHFTLALEKIKIITNTHSFYRHDWFKTLYQKSIMEYDQIIIQFCPQILIRNKWCSSYIIYCWSF